MIHSFPMVFHGLPWTACSLETPSTKKEESQIETCLQCFQSFFEITLVEGVLTLLHRSSRKDAAQLDLREDEKIIRINSSNLLDCQQQTFLHIGYSIRRKEEEL